MQTNEAVREKTPKRAVPADKKTIDMIEEAILDEMEDAEYYGRLINMATDPQEKEILRQIRLDEQKHEMIFRSIYQKLCGEQSKVEPDKKPVGKNLRNEYEKSIFSELAGVDFYKKIYLTFLNLEIRDMVFDVYTDEQTHAIKFTYLSGRPGRS